MIGARTNITSAHLKNAISKIWTSLDKYLTALCIKTKNKPDKIIIKIAIKGAGIFVLTLLKYLMILLI